MYRACGAARGHAAVDQWVFVAEALDLAGTRLQHLGAEVCGGCAWGHLGELGEGDGGDLDVQINAVQERTGDLAEVLLDLRWRAGAGASRVGPVAAGIGDHPMNFCNSLQNKQLRYQFAELRPYQLASAVAKSLCFLN